MANLHGLNISPTSSTGFCFPKREVQCLETVLRRKQPDLPYIRKVEHLLHAELDKVATVINSVIMHAMCSPVPNRPFTRSIQTPRYGLYPENPREKPQWSYSIRCMAHAFGDTRRQTRSRMPFIALACMCAISHLHSPARPRDGPP